MQEIHPGLLWIGNALDIRQPRVLFDAQIAAVVDVAYEASPATTARSLIYCRFPLNDGGGNDSNTLIQTLKTTIGLVNTNTRTVIACSAGLSRSPTIAAFALAFRFKLQPQEVIVEISKMISLELNRDFWSDVSIAFRQLK